MSTSTEHQPTTSTATVFDIVFTVILSAMLGVPSMLLADSMGNRALAVLVSVAALVQVAALGWRRSRPELSALVVGGAAVTHFALGSYLLPSDVAVLISLYSLTSYGSPRSHRYGLGATMVGSVMQAIANPWGFDDGLLGFAGRATFYFTSCATLALAAWALGLARRASRVQRESLADRAARLERERDQQAQIATQAERTRIAREMHDIVAHSLSVVIAQADGGRYAATADPAAATRALETISETGRAALADMRRILGVLRTDGGDASDLVPQPGETDIENLIAHVRETLPTSYIEMGDPRPMPPGTGSTVYRIAQEALTNAIKHGGPGAKATVMLHWAPQHLVLQIDDDGRGAAAASDGAGHGVLGMRERATMLGGSLVAGPRPGGGYRIRAEIPIPGMPASIATDPPLLPARTQ